MLSDAAIRRAHRHLRCLPKRRYDVVLDVGAYDGEFAEHCSHYFASQRLCLVEANPTKARALQDKFAKHQRFSVVHSAITDRDGPLSFRVNQHAASSSILPMSADAENLFGTNLREEASVTVPGLRLDTLFKQEGLSHVDLMKVDIQGAEKLLIAGGLEALSHIDVIVMEVLFEPMYEGSALFGELHAELLKLGFHLQDLLKLRRGAGGILAYGDAVYTRTGA